jgi:hypothetical protein
VALLKYPTFQDFSEFYYLISSPLFIPSSYPTSNGAISE